MSRTKRGNKAGGFEWWSKRPGKGQYDRHGSKDGKRRTHKAERAEGKKDINMRNIDD